MADAPNAAFLTRRPRVAGEALSEWRSLEHLLLFVVLITKSRVCVLPEAGLQYAEKPVRVPGKGDGTTAALGLWLWARPRHLPSAYI